MILAQLWSQENCRYVDASGKTIIGAREKGITVTKYQNRASEAAGGIDWEKVAADGVKFAMVRLGYYKDMDPYFAMNLEGAAANGIKTGVFLYTQALDVATAINEAKYVLELVREYPISYPIAYDVESQHMLDSGLSKQQITDQVNAFCKTISDAGYHPIVYANQEWLSNHMDTAQIPYDIWYARYGTINKYQNRTIWQCTDNGTVAGIQGNVTIEFSFTDYVAQIPPDSWKFIDGNWYYMKNYRKQTGWVQVKNHWYYLDSNGRMLHDAAVEIDGVSYTFGSDGRLTE
ncbi:MAG: GH25 family lysozyme [Hungatella sp.]